jgi:hypothetical protein
MDGWMDVDVDVCVRCRASITPRSHLDAESNAPHAAASSTPPALAALAHEGAAAA